MRCDLPISRQLIDKAMKEESAQVFEGNLPNGIPVLVVVVTGAQVGLFKQHAGDCLSIFKDYGKKP